MTDWGAMFIAGAYFGTQGHYGACVLMFVHAFVSVMGDR